MDSNHIPHWFLAGFLLGVPMLVSACNTMEGMGRDIGAAGGAISDTAEDTEEEIEE